MTVFEAMQFNGENRREALSFAYPSLSKTALKGAELARLPVIIETSEGHRTARAGDWIIRAAAGDLYLARNVPGAPV